MGAGPSTNLYRIGGELVTHWPNYIFKIKFVFFIINAASDKINVKYVVGDPLT